MNYLETGRNRGQDEHMACEPMKTHELKMGNEDRYMTKKKTNNRRKRNIGS